MLRATLRILQATRVVLRYRLDEPLFHLALMRNWRWARHALPWHWRAEERSFGLRLRLALEELGPVAIKMGQALATRRDLLPLEVADELARLQDRVPPFPGAVARRIVEETYNAPVERVFAEFSETPLAAASIAQVHAARLKDGREVVVKLLRPGVDQRIRDDLRVMYLMARFVERFVPDGRRLRAREVIADYEKTILDELDLVREGANAAQTRRNFEDRPILYVPMVHWELTHRHVLVMERIHGIPISDIAALKARGVNFRFLAERGVEIFFTQVFRHNFFHADMHAGNIFVDTRDPARPGYLAVDFGIVGSLGRDDQRYIAHNIYAFFNGDYRRVAELHVASGWVRPDTRVEDLESVIRTLCEPILFRPFKDIHLDQLLLRLFEIARRFDMEVQPQLVLLQKTLVQIEGLGRQLYPDLDLWTTAKPFMERWMREQLGPRGIYREFKERLPDLAQRLPLLPLTLDHALQAVTELPARQQALTLQIAQLEQRLPVRRHGAWLGLGGSLLLLAGFLGGVAAAHPFAAPPALLVATLSAMGGLFSLLRARRT